MTLQLSVEFSNLAVWSFHLCWPPPDHAVGVLFGYIVGALIDYRTSLTSADRRNYGGDLGEAPILTGFDGAYVSSHQAVAGSGCVPTDPSAVTGLVLRIRVTDHGVRLYMFDRWWERHTSDPGQ